MKWDKLDMADIQKSHQEFKGCLTWIYYLAQKPADVHLQLKSNK